MSESDSPQPIDIVTRLRQTRANMIGTEDEQHYFDCHEAAAEIERLRQWGTLTDAEREVIERASRNGWSCDGSTLRMLLERTRNGSLEAR